MAGMAVFAAQAPAKDRNKNGIQDAWEVQHGLSVKKDQGSRDADADGASNRCEYQAKTDPNVADTNANGIVDGSEDTDGDGATNSAESSLHSDCGRANSHWRIRRATVTSFDGSVLVLTVKGGGTVTAPVAAGLKCTVKSATSSSAGAGTNGHKGGSNAKPASCTIADLVAGSKVQKAKIQAKQFVEITLVK
jgi:hypothetical protein